MKTLKQRRWCRSGVFFVNKEHIAPFVLITEVERANISLGHIEETNRQQSRMYQALFCSILSINKIY